MSVLLSSMAPVDGEVSLVRSHFVMAVRSYVKPSDVQTGSVMISAVIGHTHASSTSADGDGDGNGSVRGGSGGGRFEVRQVEAAVRSAPIPW